MKKILRNNYKIIVGILIGILFSLTTVYAVEAYIESKKVSYDNPNKKITAKENVQEAIDELYERSGIHQEEWEDPTLKDSGTYPILKDPLIPVEIKPNGDVYYANLNSEWYNYSEKRWANAVILIDNPSNTNYVVGDKIEEDDIESYFVWIPRFSYKIWDTGNYNNIIYFSDLTNSPEIIWKLAGSNSRLIDIKFVKTTVKDSGNEIDSYLTHPAFTLGDKNLSGIWMGKFETGGSATNLVIRPDETAWRNASVKTFFDTAKGYEKDLDSHMMKNTEWGAVAYLSHSAYGIGNKVNVNNTNDYKTGYSSTANADQITYPGVAASSSDTNKTQAWNTSIGYLASTTGNITGIYDMGGGAFEYMASYVEGTNGVNDKSEFSLNELNNYINQGYIDMYPANPTYNKRILGDATGELGPFFSYQESGIDYYHSSWYGGFAYFANSLGSPWFVRGGLYNEGSSPSQFSFTCASGGTDSRVSFRLVLAPSK